MCIDNDVQWNIALYQARGIQIVEVRGGTRKEDDSSLAVALRADAHWQSLHPLLLQLLHILLLLLRIFLFHPGNFEQAPLPCICTNPRQVESLTSNLCTFVEKPFHSKVFLNHLVTCKHRNLAQLYIIHPACFFHGWLIKSTGIEIKKAIYIFRILLHSQERLVDEISFLRWSPSQLDHLCGAGAGCLWEK